MKFVILIIGFAVILLVALVIRKSCRADKSKELLQKVDRIITGDIKVDENDLLDVLAELLVDTKQAREMGTIDEETRAKNIERADTLFNMLKNVKNFN